MDKLLDEIESYWSTRTEGYSEVNEKELKGMQKKAWLETLERGFFGKRSGKNEDSENNSVEKEVFEEEFSEKAGFSAEDSVAGAVYRSVGSCYGY